MTVRGVFYRLVDLKVVEKSERAYQKVVIPRTTRMRLADELPWDWIVDSTRWVRKPTTHSSLRAMLEDQASLYRRDLWASRDVSIEVWCEKETLAGVLFEETKEWDVPLYTCRGYPSLTLLHDVAEFIEDSDKATYIYYFGDLDPSGVDITRVVESRLREFAPDSEIHFARVAVTREQVDLWHLPTRPTKTTDSRSNGFSGRSVELDAIRPRELRRIVRGCIQGHVDQVALARTKTVEAAERETLAEIARGLPMLGGAA